MRKNFDWNAIVGNGSEGRILTYILSLAQWQYTKQWPWHKQWPNYQVAHFALVQQVSQWESSLTPIDPRTAHIHLTKMDIIKMTVSKNVTPVVDSTATLWVLLAGLQKSCLRTMTRLCLLLAPGRQHERHWQPLSFLGPTNNPQGKCGSSVTIYTYIENLTYTKCVWKVKIQSLKFCV